MKRFIPYLALVTMVALVGCSGDSPRPTPVPTVVPDAWSITSLTSSSTGPFVNTVVLIEATVTKDGSPSPDNESVAFLASGGAFASGTLEASGRVIKLDGINPIPSDETCNDKSGTKWLCGTRARLALTRFIRGRAVVCKVPEKDKAKALTARCSLASKDLSVWVAAQGWAKPAAPPKPKIAKAADQARKKKIGIWR